MDARRRQHANKTRSFFQLLVPVITYVDINTEQTRWLIASTVCYVTNVSELIRVDRLSCLHGWNPRKTNLVLTSVCCVGRWCLKLHLSFPVRPHDLLVKEAGTGLTLEHADFTGICLCSSLQRFLVCCLTSVKVDTLLRYLDRSS